MQKMKNSKILVYVVGLWLCSMSLADPNATVRTGSSQDSIDKSAITIYYELYTDVNSAGVVQPTDFNDANTLVYKNFSGALYELTIDPNGTDTSFTVDIWYDPPEPTAALKTKKLYKLAEFTVNATDGAKTYTIPNTDNNSNSSIGHWIRGDIYIGRRGTSHSVLNNLKVYIHGSLKK
jgi:hypothetical protein